MVAANAEISNRKEIAMVRRFLKLWKEDQLFYTALMMDVFRIFERFPMTVKSQW